MSSPWAKIEKSEPVKLEEIMAEEVAKNVQTKQERRGLVKVGDDKTSTADEFVWVTDTASEGIPGDDSASELNEEYELECLEENCGSSCINNCCRLSSNIECGDSENEEIDDLWEEDEYDMPDEFVCPLRNVFKGNIREEMAEYTTVWEGKQSTCKLSSKVFNSLEVPIYDKEFRRYKVHRDKRKRPTTTSLCIDQHAWHLIRQMIKDKVLLKVEGVLSFDEDSITLRGIQSWPIPNKYTYSISPRRCAIKVFKINSKLDKATACQKAATEVANYERLKAAGIRSLCVVAHKEHVVITSYQGKTLRYAAHLWSVYRYEYVYDTVRSLMKKFYEANLIYTNLSVHNILVCWSGACIFINLCQCVNRSDEGALDFLFKGCTNIVNYFKRKAFTSKSMTNPDALFKYITGYSFLDKQSLLELQKSIKTKNK